MPAGLNTKIQFLPGVGPKMAEKLNRLGLATVQDLFFYYPRTYLDFSNIKKIKEITKIQDTRYNQISNSNNQRITIKGTIVGISNKRTTRRRFTVTETVVEDGSGSIKVVWFNQPFLAKMLKAGREITLNGKISYNFYNREVVMESPERAIRPMIVPVYGETAGLTSNFISKLLSSVAGFLDDFEEYVPSGILKKYDLLGIREALKNIHNPRNAEMLERARNRIAFDELFIISLRANLSRLEIKKESAPAIKNDAGEIEKFVAGLSFELTGDQKKAIDQILKDMNGSTPMSRLLNGDVGSGKTVVAALAAYAAVEDGHSVAVMAPTEILAQQHYNTFCELFKKKPISIGLWTSSSKDFQGPSSKGQAARGKSQKPLGSCPSALDADIVVGTQALIQKGVELENLGLVVVDEQHRFGVSQRAALQQLASNKKQDTITSKITNSKLRITNKSLNSKFQTLNSAQKMRPHFLSMTATPIPRTLHLALFGDLDLSVIKEKPVGRKDIKTRFVEPHYREKAYQFIRAHMKAGRQVFVICPLIEEGQGARAESQELFEEDRKSVKAEYKKLQEVFPEFKIGMLHGRMKTKEKDEVMADFSANRLDMIVSTSVVEVGVDVPNATVMMIEDAERFGLAQLHQFRGRVGRSDHQSFCFLFSTTMSDKAIQRLKALESTSDGFKLAEIDLEQRGPGAVFGTEQSGLLDLKMADFSDRMLIEEATAAAKSIVENDPDLKSHPLLEEKISNYLQNKHME